LLVENELIVELKAVKALANEHEAQILGYLKSARMEHGLLINFGFRVALAQVEAAWLQGTEPGAVPSARAQGGWQMQNQAA
jgi:hypothetical protein